MGPTTMRDFFFDDPFFKSSWDDFDTVREKMHQESRDMWKKFDDDFRNMACMSNNIMLNDSSSSNSNMPSSSKSSSNESSDNRMLLDRQTSLDKWENGWMFPRRWMLPSLKNEFKDMNLFQSKDSEVIRVKEDDNKMEVSLDTSQYRPDELSVSVSAGVVSVEGKHEEKLKMEVKWSADSLLENILCLMEPNLKMLSPISLLMEFLSLLPRDHLQPLM